MPRYAARADANQTEVIAALRGIGAQVESLHRVGGGVPDLLVGWRGKNLLLEVKDGEKSPSKRNLTAYQDDWFRTWEGQATVVTSAKEALEYVYEQVKE